MSQKIIYLKGDPQKGTTLVAKQKSAKSIGRLFSWFLITGGLASLLLFAAPFLLLETKWRLGLMKTGSQEKTVIKESALGKIIRTTDLQILQPADSQFSVIIPKIGVNSTVLANIPAEDKEAYDSALKQGVAHAAGSYLPGQNGSVYLFGHSTDYIWNVARLNAVFYLLKELEPNDQVNIFYRGQRYTYQVVAKKIVASEDPELLRVPSGTEQVILLTCWPPGTVWKRLAVWAEKV